MFLWWYRYQFQKQNWSKKVSVSKNFGIRKSIGIGFENFWYRKKYRIRFRKILVSKKVSVSVTKKFGIEKSIGIGFVKFWYRKKYRYRYRKKNWYRKKYRIRYRKYLVSEKSFGFGFVQIWGFVTHWLGQLRTTHAVHITHSTNKQLFQTFSEKVTIYKGQ